MEKLGLFYPPDPASKEFSTLGGNVAECAGGPRCVKYGVTKDYVLGLEVVTPTGEIIRTGGRTMKNVVGYDLTRLFVGSEGTLGIVTRIILRLLPKPEAKKTMLVAVSSPSTARRRRSRRSSAPRSSPPPWNSWMRPPSTASAGPAPSLLDDTCRAVLIIEVDGDRPLLDPQVEQDHGDHPALRGSGGADCRNP